MTMQKVEEIEDTINVEIVIDPPPNWDFIHKHFPDASLDYQIFAYADKIYWKHQLDGQKLSQDLVVHEVTHCKQQRFTVDGANWWWKQYANDPGFRLSQEIEAMRAQMAAARRMTRDRNELFKLAMTQAKNIASPVYNNMVTVDEAYRLIIS